MGTTKAAPEKISLVSTVVQQCDWTVTSDKGRTFENVRLEEASDLAYSNLTDLKRYSITLSIHGLGPVLPEGLAIDFPLPDGYDTLGTTGTSDSNRYSLTANSDGKTFTIRCRDGVFTFTPQKAKTPQTADTPQTTK